MSDPKNFINGAWTSSVDGGTLDVFEPATGAVIGQIVDSSQADVDAAVKAARDAFDTGAWGKTTAIERGRILQRFGDLILRDADRLAECEARDTGKPVTVARNDIIALARYFEFYGGA
ncbi:hypothetical protein LTR94_029071, partial [Friedmanniomyces endolithicus]